MTDRVDLVRQLAHHLAASSPVEPLTLRLCRAAVAVARADDGAVVLMGREGERVLLCATSRAAELVEDHQDLAAQGPGVEAAAQDAPAGFHDAEEAARRWPRLAQAALGAGLRAYQALPMRRGEQVVGVFSVHHAPGAPPVPGDLAFLADTLAAAVVAEVEHDQATWRDRDRLAQATGMVVAQLDVDAHDALAVIRARAFAEGSSVHELSRRIVEREIDLEAGDKP